MTNKDTKSQLKASASLKKFINNVLGEKKEMYRDRSLGNLTRRNETDLQISNRNAAALMM